MTQNKMRKYLAVIFVFSQICLVLMMCAIVRAKDEYPNVNDIKSLLASGQNDINSEMIGKTNIEISKMGKPIIPALLEIINDKQQNSFIRRRSIVILRLMKDVTAVDSLIETLNDKDWLIRDAAQNALMEITGHNFGKNVSKWTTWWSESKPNYLNLIGDCINRKSLGDKNPCWVKEIIAREELYPVANPPASLTKCNYKNQTVYYLPPRCCDVPSVLFDENGKIICSPDGGFAGHGDGKCVNFSNESKDCEIIWRDSRYKKSHNNLMSDEYHNRLFGLASTL